MVSGSAALLLRRPRPNASAARAASARPVAGVHIGPTQRFLLVPVRAPRAGVYTHAAPLDRKIRKKLFKLKKTIYEF